MRYFRVFVLSVLCFSVNAYGQGQDSKPYERDFQVISAMLAGGFDNANQSYFDRRGQRETRHRRLHLDIVEVKGRPHHFQVTANWNDKPTEPAARYSWSLAVDHQERAVVLTSRYYPPGVDPGIGDSASAGPCRLIWHRSAAEFVADAATAGCGRWDPARLVLSEAQLWLTIASIEGGDFALHRVREFECYADIPGVGGGRAEPYDRYDGLRLHDRGGQVWFDSKDGRRLGISLLLVDWPINNYRDAFARDSLVVYLSEETDGERKELGYAFTVPDADRIGINLKWLLANCYMQSNKDVTPFM
ncbi:MAG: hypothetical protein AAGE85_02410 [Pseudomonadota bacterium]